MKENTVPERKNKSCKIIIYDEYNNEIKADIETDRLASMLVWKEETKRKKKLKQDNKYLTDLHGEKIMIFQDMLKRATKELTLEELKVFNYLIAICDFENWINISQKELATELSTQVSNISRAIKGISQKGYVEIIKKNNSNYYHINPEAAWKGTFENWKKVIELKPGTKKK